MSRDGHDSTHPRAAPADRYTVESILGRGGMATVQQVIDRATGRRVALKRLHPELVGEHRTKTFSMFEREYLTLAQLAHPRIVTVYDYGVDAQGPYYTMELLDGGDLQTLAPLPWRRACALARDVCSALALLHSRRLVYRDLSPRNVRCTSDGLAKLIDFGAMAVMGPSRDVVGTPPCIPPEALNQQPLDARTDLYGLGATLYFTLLQRHAYPARDVDQLRATWRSPLRRPSELLPGIPQALDRLIADLMQLDPSLRPASASEVMARLGALAGLRVSEQVLVSQAYLASPTLVGRAEVLDEARPLILRALKRRGASLLVHGAAGLGRSRMLDALVLEGKLAGLTVLRADASDAQEGSYGVVRALAAQLIKELGSVARDRAQRHLPSLAHAIPELLSGGVDRLARAPDPPPQDRQVRLAVRQWLLDVARARPLMIAVDDLPRIDEPSAACIALLAQELASHRLLIATTIGEDDVASSPVRNAVELLYASSTQLPLTPLTLALTEQLLSSVFGDVPNLARLARYMHGITEGNPRDIMGLAQHLVDEALVRYEAGAWSLPAQLDSAGLPSNMAEALGARVARITTDARWLALAFALEPTQTFTLEECAPLSIEPVSAPSAHLLQALEELVAAEVLRYGGERYGLRQASWIAPIEAAFSDAQRAVMHLRLADTFSRRDEGFRTARHLLDGGELDRGLDVLLDYSARSEQLTDADGSAFATLLNSLPPDWLSVYEHALRLCDARGRPARERDVLLSRVCGLVPFAVGENAGYTHIEARIAQLRRDSGLDDFAALPSTLDYATRLKRAMTEAATRFHTTPEHERVHDPSSAIKQLVKTVLTALGRITFTLDYDACCRLPSLAPLAALTPTAELVVNLTEGLKARLAGRSEAAMAIYEALLVRLAQPDRAGLTPMHHLTGILRIKLGIGMLEAAMGRASCLRLAEELERAQMMGTIGMFIRHIFHVWQGDSEAAARMRRQIEVVHIENNLQHGFDGLHSLSELAAYAMADDLTCVQRAVAAIEPRAKVHPAWRPAVRFGRGEYQRIRGDHGAALAELEAALALMTDGRHQLWAHAAGAHIRVLNELGRHDEACALGESYLQTAADVCLGYMRNYIRMPLSIALGKAGLHTGAAALAEQVLDELLQLGSTGLLLAAAYEARARVALEAEDEATFERHAALCAEQSRAAERRLLGLQYRRQSERTSQRPPSMAPELSLTARFSLTVVKCENAEERLRCGLSFLARRSGAEMGVLYTCSRGSAVRAATFGDPDLDAHPELDAWAATFLEHELDRSDDTAALSTPPSYTSAFKPRVLGDSHYVPVLLAHQSERGTAITGVALLATPDEASFTYPGRLAAEVSRAIASAGDVAPVYT